MTPRTSLFLAGLLAPMAVLAAQVTPPAPPVTAAPPATPTPSTTPTPRVRVLEPGAYYIDGDQIRRLTDEARALGENARMLAPRAIDMEHMASMAREQALMSIDHDAIRRATETVRLDADRIRDEALRVAERAPRAIAMPDFNFDFHFDNMMATPAPRVSVSGLRQGDPADSLYLRASKYFNNQEYRQAANLYAEFRAKYTSSSRYCTASYYEAFSRQRLGLPEDLRTGKKVLEAAGTRCSNQSQDYQGVLLRINTALMNLGDKDAEAEVQRVRKAGNVCDSEDRMAKAAALSALSNNDPAGTAPMLKNVLAGTDKCSAELRREAMRLVARSNDATAASILVNSAKNDPELENRRQAVSMLSSIDGDAAFSAIEDLLRNSTDQSIQRSAASAMARSNHPKAQDAVRALIVRKDVDEAVRVSALSALSSREMISGEWWRSLYAQLESEQLKVTAISAMGRAGSMSDETAAFLLGIAKNQNEPPAVRSAALSRISRTAPIADLAQILRTADSRSMRMSIVSGLSSRKEAEATDRLIDIAKTSSDIEVRTRAISALSSSERKDDPKVKKALCEILSGGGC